MGTEPEDGEILRLKLHDALESMDLSYAKFADFYLWETEDTDNETELKQWHTKFKKQMSRPCVTIKQYARFKKYWQILQCHPRHPKLRKVIAQPIYDDTDGPFDASFYNGMKRISKSIDEKIKNDDDFDDFKE
ncbi:MAG: hypothetical protein JKY17_05555 [Magnetovibrio sp.]|nr:hypothetical protein [Magnetovibrio sp.]